MVRFDPGNSSSQCKIRSHIAVQRRQQRLSVALTKHRNSLDLQCSRQRIVDARQQGSPTRQVCQINYRRKIVFVLISCRLSSTLRALP
jgi:hypothetical protein